MIVNIKKSIMSGKKYMVTFSDGQIVHFGNAYEDTYIDHHNLDLRRNYRKVHKNYVSTKDNYNPIKLTYYLLWGKSRYLNKNVTFYNKKFFNIDSSCIEYKRKYIDGDPTE